MSDDKVCRCIRGPSPIKGICNLMTGHLCCSACGSPYGFQLPQDVFESEQNNNYASAKMDEAMYRRRLGDT